MELYLKAINGHLIADNEESASFLFQMKQGSVLRADVKRPRNYQFMKKYFALLDYAYDSWEPEIPEKYKGHDIEKNKEVFRKNIQIMAGYGYPIITVKNEVRYESKSISFGSMQEEEFEKLYSSVINVVLKHILTNYTRDDLERVVEDVLRFA